MLEKSFSEGLNYEIFIYVSLANIVYLQIIGPCHVKDSILRHYPTHIFLVSTWLMNPSFLLSHKNEKKIIQFFQVLQYQLSGEVWF